jgi:hypothetical protein
VHEIIQGTASTVFHDDAWYCTGRFQGFRAAVVDAWRSEAMIGARDSIPAGVDWIRVKCGNWRSTPRYEKGLQQRSFLGMPFTGGSPHCIVHHPMNKHDVGMPSVQYLLKNEWAKLLRVCQITSQGQITDQGIHTQGDASGTGLNRINQRGLQSGKISASNHAKMHRTSRSNLSTSPHRRVHSW